MQTFTLSAPNTCALVHYPGTTGKIVNFVSGSPGVLTFAPDEAVYEQFTTTAACVARGQVLEPQVNTSPILGDLEFIEASGFQKLYTGAPGTTVVLDGSHTTAGGDSITYRWSLHSKGQQDVALGNSSTISVVVPAYGVEALYELTLKATHSQGQRGVADKVLPVVGA